MYCPTLPLFLTKEIWSGTNMACLLARFPGSLIGRRAYSAAAVVGRSVEEKVTLKKDNNSSFSSPAATKSSWVPDPVSGDYRPVNSRRDGDDAVEMRDKLLHHTSQD